MITQEFEAAVNEKKLLRTRIMLKDSLIIDPTFEQFNEMRAYAERKLKDSLYEAFDGGELEADELKWNEDIMNEELVCLVTNFSKTRISHLQEVVRKVLKSRVEEIGDKKKKQDERKVSQVHREKTSDMNRHNSRKLLSNSRSTSGGGNKVRPEESLMTIKKKIEGLYGVIKKIDKEQGVWKGEFIDKIEEYTKEITKELEKYRDNKAK